MNGTELTSIAAVIALTTTLVQLFKIALREVPILKNIPMIILAVALSCGLCGLAVLAGTLKGNLGTLMAQTVIAALGSSGLFSALSGSSTQKIKDTNPDVDKYYTTLSICVILGGCTLMAAGCQMLSHQKTSEGRLMDAKQDYLAVIEFVTFLRDQHIMSQADVNKYKSSFDTAQTALKTWDLALKVNDTQTADAAEQQWLRALDILKAIRQQYAPKPATQPSADGDKDYVRNNGRTVSLGRIVPQRLRHLAA